MLKPTSLPALRPVKAEDYVPPVSGWVLCCGMVLIGGFGVAIALAAVMRYDVAVRAEATVRPSGGVHLVQAELDGTVADITVQANQSVQQGEVMAQLNRDRLETQENQLQLNLRQTQMQLAQIQVQRQFLDMQIAAERRSRDQSVATAQAQLRRDQRDYVERQSISQADLAEAEAALAFAQNEMQRYEQLAASGAIAQLQLAEKQAAVRTAQAQVSRASASLNPSDAPVAIAEGQIGQQAASGAATLASLNRERQGLLQLQLELQKQLQRDQGELQQIATELDKTTIRATSDGVILQLNLRNANQVVRAGDTIAEIAPRNAASVIKARVQPQDINQVAVGQTAQMRLSACPYPDYGVLLGQVTAIAPDAIAPSSYEGTVQSSYYEVTIQPSAPSLVRGERICPLQPGMEAEVSIISRSETPLMLLLRRARLWVTL